MEDLIKQLQGALFAATERAEKAEAERDAAYLAVFSASETVLIGHGRAMPTSWFREYDSVIRAARKMGDE